MEQDFVSCANGGVRVSVSWGKLCILLLLAFWHLKAIEGCVYESRRVIGEYQGDSLLRIC